MKVILATVAATACLLLAPVVVAAPMYHVEIETVVVPLVFVQGVHGLPLPMHYAPVDLEVEFLVDPSTEQLFGDFNCGRVYAHCGAHGYEVSDLRVYVNGVEASGWRTGTNAQSFWGPPMDLKGREFFVPGGLAEPFVMWLPLVHDDFTGAAMSFGQMYPTTSGGVGFAAPNFHAVDAAGSYRAIGWDLNTRSTLVDVADVPAPATTALLMVGLALLGFRRRCKT